MPGFAARLNEELGAALVIANEFVANARSRNYSVQASDYISIDVENNSAEEMDLIIPDRVRVGSTVECTLPANASRESGNPIAIPIIGAGWF
jgi:isopropylmalate/homocitrate/citramalate synthase